MGIDAGSGHTAFCLLARAPDLHCQPESPIASSSGRNRHRQCRWLIQQQIIAVGVFAGVASISVAAPLLSYTVAGPRVLGPLSHAKDCLLRNNVAVLVIVFLLLGALLTLNGVTGLLASA